MNAAVLAAASWAGEGVRRWVVGRVARWHRLVAPDAHMHERGHRANGFGSRFEERTHGVLRRLLPAVQWEMHLRPAWLTYPPTGRRLELDFYNAGLQLAVEVDGIQHRTFVPPIHRSMAGFRAQVRRDRWKDRRCRRLGVRLLRVPDTASLCDADIERCLRPQLASLGLL